MFLEDGVWLTSADQENPLPSFPRTAASASLGFMLLFLPWQLSGSNSIHLPDSSTPSSAGQYNQLHSSLNPFQKSISEAFQSLTQGLREAPPFNWTPTNQKVTPDVNPAREERQSLPSFCTVCSVPRFCPSHLSQLLLSKQLNSIPKSRFVCAEVCCLFLVKYDLGSEYSEWYLSSCSFSF